RRALHSKISDIFFFGFRANRKVTNVHASACTERPLLDPIIMIDQRTKMRKPPSQKHDEKKWGRRKNYKPKKKRRCDRTMAARIPALCRFHTFDSRGGAKMLTRKTAMVFVAALAACMLLLGFQGAMAKTYSPKQMQGMCEKAGKATWARLGAVA